MRRLEPEPAHAAAAGLEVQVERGAGDRCARIVGAELRTQQAAAVEAEFRVERVGNRRAHQFGLQRARGRAGQARERVAARSHRDAGAERAGDRLQGRCGTRELVDLQALQAQVERVRGRRGGGVCDELARRATAGERECGRVDGPAPFAQRRVRDHTGDADRQAVDRRDLQVDVGIERALARPLRTWRRGGRRRGAKVGDVDALARQRRAQHRAAFCRAIRLLAVELRLARHVAAANPGLQLRDDPALTVLGHMRRHLGGQRRHRRAQAEHAAEVGEPRAGQAQVEIEPRELRQIGQPALDVRA